MLLLVFFLSHVDDSHDKVLKLAPLKRLLSKVNFYLPIERPGVFIFNEAPRYDSRGFVVSSIFVSRARTCVCQPTCSCMFMRTCVNSVCGNIMCGIRGEWAHGNCPSSTRGSTWNDPVTAESQSPHRPLSCGVTWIPGYCLSNTAAPLPSAPLPRDCWDSF